MVCGISQRKFSEFSASLNNMTIKKRILYTGALELTYRCNLSCVHCFCNLGLCDARKKEELALSEIRHLLDELAEAGCLWLLLTGGEVMVREDFLDIYKYASSKGMFLEIFTNGTMITDDIARAFADHPPLSMEISIYGSSAEVHDRVTRTTGSFLKTMQGIEKLKKHDVPVSLKAMALTVNIEDLENMQRLGRDLGIEFRLDALVCGRRDGDRAPLEFRLPVEKVIELELKDKENTRIWAEIFREYWKMELKDFYRCSAGINFFNIDPYGYLSPCTMFSSFQYSLKNNSIQNAWSQLIRDYGDGRFNAAECQSCRMVALCPSCPAWGELETRELGKKVDYLCQYALEFEKKLIKIQKEGLDAEKILSEAGN